MEDLDDSDISFDEFLAFQMFSDCDISSVDTDFSSCGPPIFNLPPPPRPHWMGDINPCTDSTCPNDPIVHSISTHSSDNGWDTMFHNVITVVVASISIVISLLVLVAFIIRYRFINNCLLLSNYKYYSFI